MYFSAHVTSLLTLLCLSVTTFASETPNVAPCRPFRVYRDAEVPEAPKPGSEAAKNLKACIAHYGAMDLNQNGIKDWSADIDGRTSSVLFPNDDDLDGDGTPNVLDRRALTSDDDRAIGIPSHLKMKGKRGRLQKRLFESSGVIAIDHTDQHSPAVLEAMIEVLGELAKGQRLESVKYVYAFSGHDALEDIAAYHRQVRAISIGGRSAYPRAFAANSGAKLKLMGSIAHEFGHAFLFERVSPAELGEIAVRFGHWQAVIGDTKIDSFTADERLFRAHPLRNLARITGLIRAAHASQMATGLSIWREANLVSEYAATNLHEWFADAFAAAAIHRLGERGRLGQRWREALMRIPRAQEGFWVNYNNLRPDFRAWIEDKSRPNHQR